MACQAHTACLVQDVMMPDVDGVELLRHVRGDDSLNSMPVVSAQPLCTHFAVPAAALACRMRLESLHSLQPAD